MLKTLVRAGTLLLIGAFFITATAGASDRVTDEFIIPLNQDVKLSNNLTVHLIQLTVSNLTYGGAYSADPVNSVWPILVFQYENQGRAQAACRLHAQLVDNAGALYDKTDMTIPQPIYPGQKTTLVTLEWAVPKGRTLTKLIVIDDALKNVTAEIPIVYPTPTPVEPLAPVLGLLEEEGEDMRTLMVIPILLGVVGLIGWFMARKRLF